MTLSIFTDGGARGNPGPAACAFVVKKDEEVVFQQSRFLGIMTNNQAEYHGVLLAVEWLDKFLETNKVQKINFYLDSLLVSQQLSNIYKIKNPDLKNIYDQIQDYLKNKTRPFFNYIPRSKNFLADSLLNEELDKQLLN